MPSPVPPAPAIGDKTVGDARPGRFDPAAEPALDDADLVDPALQEPLVLRPDGWYWDAPDGHQSFGPFATREQALADLHAADPQAPEPGETLREAEAELGIADWVDPETGAPAEGQGNPHLPQD